MKWAIRAGDRWVRKDMLSHCTTPFFEHRQLFTSKEDLDFALRSIGAWLRVRYGNFEIVEVPDET